MLFAGGADGDFNVLTEGGEKFHEAADAEVAGAIAHEQGDLESRRRRDFGWLDFGNVTGVGDGVTGS